ncbi:MAG TPA: hypothetical protein VEM38_13270 [Burkholderiales bacterium]|nr:hypothetical protein [Burkholderiales bacterium]
MAEADTGFDFGDILSNIDSAAETAGNLANKVIAFRSAEAKRNLDQTLANTQAQAQVNVAKVQADKAIADAQAPIKKGAFDSNTLLILLTLAGLAIAAVSIVRSRK